MDLLAQIQAATLSARAATGDSAISTRADAGKLQIVRAVPLPGGEYDIRPVTGWLAPMAAVDALKELA